MKTPILTTGTHTFYFRPATIPDIPAINEMIAHSVRTLHSSLYSPEIIESAIKYVYSVSDEGLVRDGCFFVVEAFAISSSLSGKDIVNELGGKGGDEGEGEIVTAGAWTFRSTLNGESRILDPEREAARLKAMYVHPSFTRLGSGNLMLGFIEGEVKRRGYGRLEFGATFAGVKFYERAGYEVLKTEGNGGEGRCDKVMDDGGVLELILMGRDL
jgi:hypothetical protein